MKDFIARIIVFVSKWLKPTLFGGFIWGATLFIFFAIVMPIITRHSQLVEVPNVCEMSAEEATSFLEKKNFRCEIVPSSVYKPKLPLHNIIEQYPKAGATVKKNRKIYLTENCNKLAYVSMPNLIDNTIRNAYIVLKSKNLKLGKIDYVQDIAHNGVLEQFYSGEKILPGKNIEVGSTIDLSVGIDSMTKQTQVPEIDFLESLDDLEMALLVSGLRLGAVAYQDSIANEPGTIISQKPIAGAKVGVGTAVDFWVASEKSYVKGEEEVSDAEKTDA